MTAEDVAFIDCLTLWLSNKMLGDHDVAAAIEGIGSGLRNRLNQRIAAVSDGACLIVAGMNLTLKPNE